MLTQKMPVVKFARLLDCSIAGILCLNKFTSELKYRKSHDIQAKFVCRVTFFVLNHFCPLGINNIGR